MDIDKVTQPEFFTGSGTATASPAPIVSLGHGQPLYTGLRIKADKDNLNLLYVGRKNMGPTNGFPLKAGEEITIPVDRTDKVYVVSDGANFSWMGV